MGAATGALGGVRAASRSDSGIAAAGAGAGEGDGTIAGVGVGAGAGGSGATNCGRGSAAGSGTAGATGWTGVAGSAAGWACGTAGLFGVAVGVIVDTRTGALSGMDAGSCTSAGAAGVRATESARVDSPAAAGWPTGTGVREAQDARSTTHARPAHLQPATCP